MNLNWQLPPSDVENIWIEFRKFNRTFIIGGIYRHPNKSVSEFSQKFDKVLSIQ